jgi:hypothetical protein
MKAMGMILDLIDEVVDCKYLTVPLFQWISIGHQTMYLSWTNRAVPQQTTPHRIFR